MWILDNKSGKEIKAGIFFYINAYPEYKLGIDSDMAPQGEATKAAF
jgi:hypothetical protein